MDSQRERIQDDLRGCIEGTVECDNPSTLLYSTDGSIHQMRPMAVVCPRHWRDVVQTVKYAAEHNLGIHARGAGTSLSGESLGQGIVLDFSRFMRRIFQAQGNVVRVQAGIVRERLNAGMRPFGLFFGPNGGNQSSSTIGGQIAINSAGSDWLKFGAPASRLLSIKAVLADSSLVQFDDSSAFTAAKDSPVYELTQRLKQVYEKYARLINATPDKSSIHHAGYNLSALREGKIDYLRLLAGSEGTLAIFNEFSLRLQTIPPVRSAILFFFDSIRKAALAAKEAIHLSVDSCDLMDRRHLHLASEQDPRIDLLVPPEAEAALLIFCSGDNKVTVHEQFRTINEHLCLYKGLAFAENVAEDEDEVQIFTRLQSSIQPISSGSDYVRPVSYIDDVTVDPQRLEEFLAKLLLLMQSEGISSSIYCHAPQGQMHLHPLLNLRNAEERLKLESFAQKYYELAWSFGGYLGREHGTGLSRLTYLKQQSPEYYEVYRAIKQAFDPHNILQPGKIIAPDISHAFPYIREDLVCSESKINANQLSDSRFESETGTSAGASGGDSSSEDTPLQDLTVLQLDWHQESVAQDSLICTGCGSCRQQTTQTRACPMFRLEPQEEMSPRAKSNLVRGLVLRQLELKELISPQVKNILDGCLNCRSCQVECPVHAPVAQMILQARGAYVSAMGLSFSEQLLGHFDRLSRWAIRFRPAALMLLHSGWGRKLIEKMFGISAARKVPPIPFRSFLDEFGTRYPYTETPLANLSPGAPVQRKVMLFVNAFANYHDTALAKAAIQVLEVNNVQVVLVPNQKTSGVSALTMGMMDEAARVARHNVNIMADAIREGCDIVSCEPADVFCIKKEYPFLLDNDEDSLLVSENIYDLNQYLMKMHQSGELNIKFQPINFSLGYHAPCRLRALNIGYPGVNLLRLIPELHVEVIEAGCCGMAGIYGMQSKNYYNSLKIGMSLMAKLRNPTIQASTTECSSCRIAMEHRSTKPCVHPIKILAYAYGLMPEVGDLLRRPGKELFLS